MACQRFSLEQRPGPGKQLTVSCAAGDHLEATWPLELHNELIIDRHSAVATCCVEANKLQVVEYIITNNRTRVIILRGGLYDLYVKLLRGGLYDL